MSLDWTLNLLFYFKRLYFRIAKCHGTVSYQERAKLQFFINLVTTTGTVRSR